MGLGYCCGFHFCGSDFVGFEHFFFYSFEKKKSHIVSYIRIKIGVYFTFSMYFPILLNEFEASRAATAWVGSLNNGVYMLAGYHHAKSLSAFLYFFFLTYLFKVVCFISLGPIATLFIQRIGCRWTVMVGGMTSMIGLALSSLAPNLVTLFFTYGGITGKKKYIIVFINARMFFF